MRFGESLAAQRQALRYAKAMLLVDDGETELRQLDAFLEQRVRADRKVRFAAREALGRRAARRRGPRDELPDVPV